ncbi:MAG: hypothetical protein LUC44_03895 [Prevotellaceae bacterium]|nr:hypothetical protein [Prevotellaceae bacterium]
MKRDSIDWAEISVPVLFRKMFVPTVLGFWLAIPLAELLTLVIIIVYAASKVRRDRLW